MMRKDDLERDKLDVDIHMRAAEIAGRDRWQERHNRQCGTDPS